MADANWENVCNEANACALTGAVAFFASIRDAAIVVNGPLWCASYARRYLEMQCPSLVNRFYCTQADNEAVVYGTESCLSDTLQQLKKQCCPGIVLIINNCSIGLIGDDLAGIAREAELTCPAVCLDGGGLSGSFREGYQAAAQALLAQLPMCGRNLIRPASVNFLGCSVGYYNEANDAAELRRMLALTGVQVLNELGLGGSAASLQNMTQATLNVVMHAELGEDAARWLQEHYGMPYLVLLPPYGIADSLVWAQAILQRMNDVNTNLARLQNEADSCRESVSAAVVDLERIWNHLWFEQAVVAAPPSVAFGIARALRYEWADISQLTLLCHGGRFVNEPSTAADRVIDARQDCDAGEAVLGTLEGGLLLASNSEVYSLQRSRVKPACRQNIAMPVYDELLLPGRPFVGLRGNNNLLTALWNAAVAERRGYA